MVVAFAIGGDDALAMECGSLEVLRVGDGFGDLAWRLELLGFSVLERSRDCGDEKVGLAVFGADMDLRSPSRYGEYIVFGERRASSGR